MTNKMSKYLPLLANLQLEDFQEGELRVGDIIINITNGVIRVVIKATKKGITTKSLDNNLCYDNWVYDVEDENKYNDTLIIDNYLRITNILTNYDDLRIE